MLRKLYAFTTNYKDFYDISDMDMFIKKVSDSDKKVIMATSYSVMKVFETANKAIESGIISDVKATFETNSIRNTYYCLYTYFKKNLDSQDLMALEQECLIEYAEKCIELIADLERLGNNQNKN